MPTRALQKTIEMLQALKIQKRAFVAGGATLDTTPTIGGCCGLFDLCSDVDILSLSMAAEPFLDWLGWERSDVCEIRKNFITYARAEASGGRATSGYLANPCADSYGAEWGTCDFLLEGFRRLRRHTPTRDITKTGLRLCEQQPRYRVDGTQINDDVEFDLSITTEAIMQDLYSLIITGNHTVATDDGLFDGFQQLVNTGHVNTKGERCCSMDSIVIDWNGNNMCDDLTAGHGATWNGTAISNGFALVDVLLAAYRRVRRRLQRSPALNSPLRVGNTVLLIPMSWADCLLDCFTCWTVCPGTDDITAALLTDKAREKRDSLNGGMFGAGRIYLDGFEIPIMPYDWSMFAGGSRNADAYLLTNQVGGQRLIQGQYNDMRPVAAKHPGFDYTDGGKFLTWTNDDETCEERQVEFSHACWCRLRGHRSGSLT